MFIIDFLVLKLTRRLQRKWNLIFILFNRTNYKVNMIKFLFQKIFQDRLLIFECNQDIKFINHVWVIWFKARQTKIIISSNYCSLSTITDLCIIWSRIKVDFKYFIIIFWFLFKNLLRFLQSHQFLYKILLLLCQYCSISQFYVFFTRMIYE
jgi:hypothetical protein